jgi:tRNA(fMet)-specific endonuclease VapC
MALTVVDSDVLIDAARGREAARNAVHQLIEQNNFACTVISVFELYSGGQTERHRHKTEQVLLSATVLPLDEAASLEAARIRHRLEARGLGLGTADYLIAGICLARGLPLLTRNRNHFERVEGLRLGKLKT